MKPVGYALVGIGGYGRNHLEAIEAMEADGLARLAAVIEPNVDGCRDELDRLGARGVRHCTSLTEWIEGADREVEVVAVSAGIPWHRPLAIQALEAGYHVYLEKPPTVTIQDLRAVMAAASGAGRVVQVGFQFASGRPFEELRDALSDGAVGEVREIVGAGCWQRDDAYYQRNAWAGRFRLGELPVMDGSISNPLAHLPHIMLLLAAGSDGPERAWPTRVQGELYRAHPIGGEDLAAARISTRSGVRLCVATTAAADRESGPWLEVRGSQGVVRWDIQHTLTWSRPGAGEEVRRYQADDIGSTETLFRNLTAFLRGEAEALMNPLEGSEPYVLALNGMYESSGDTHQIPAEYVRRFPTETSVATEVSGLSDLIEVMVGRLALPSEMGVAWGVPSEPVEMEGYEKFDWEHYPAAEG